MRGTKARALRKATKNQMARPQENSERDLMITAYAPIERFAKRDLVLKDGKPTEVDTIYTEPIHLDFCFRRAYQSLKAIVKQSGQLKDVRAR